jgi:hypothetical protein
MAKFDFLDSTYKHLCIMFPGAAGGNHISNLISTVDIFEKHFISENYIDEIVSRYETVYKKYVGNKTDKISSIHGTKVHFTKYNNLEHLKIPEEKEKILQNSKKNILIGHAHCFYEMIHVTKTFVDRKECCWLIMTSPDEYSLAGKRALQGEFGILPKKNYTLPTSVGRGFKLTETDGFVVDTDLFVTMSGWEYLNEMLISNLGIQLDPKTKRMHDLWVANIIEIVGQ